MILSSMYQAKIILTYRCKIQCLASLFFRQIKYSNQDVCSCHSIVVTLLKLFPVSNQILSKKIFQFEISAELLSRCFVHY